MKILGMTTAELQCFCAELGEPAYRGRQLAEWVYKKGVSSFSEMTNLPTQLREKLSDITSVRCSKIVKSQLSSDGTTKYLLELVDGQKIESVLLPYDDRLTVCASTQVGCAAGCQFCATGMGGFKRNLTAGEIVDQVMALQREADRRVTNVVLMGMGEPLLNYNEVLKAIRLLNSEVGIAMRKLTISTVGITPRIQQLQSENLQITLAISLHAPDNDLRRQLIPMSSRYPLPGLISACRDYANATGRRVTYEYLLLAGVNDSTAHAQKLAGLLRGSLSNVNLIPYNSVPGKGFKKPMGFAINAFRQTLENFGVEVTQRFEKGHSVAAACGQLHARS